MSFELERVTKIIPCFTSMSNEELITHIQFYYPDLTGALKILLSRFENLNSKVQDLKVESILKSSIITQMESIAADSTSSCPECGTILRVADLAS